MPIDDRIKNRAYEIDPECWESYSGKPKAFKQAVDARRTASLNKATDELREQIREEIEEEPAETMRGVLEDLVRTCGGDPSEWLLHEIRRIVENAKDILERTS